MSLLPLDETTRAVAIDRAEHIRAGMLAFVDAFGELREAVARAYHGRDWLALGYESWDAYVAGEFGAHRLPSLDREERQELAASLRAEALSTRAIASVLGVSDRTVRNDLAGAEMYAPEITGADGKTYPAIRPALAVPEPGDPSCFDSEVVDAELVDEEPARVAPMLSPFAPWAAEERSLHAALQHGQTVVVNFQGHPNLIAWAEVRGLFVRVDRRSDWGNPFELPGDGDRATVIRNYAEHFLAYKPSLLGRLPELRGKALGCWCAPQPCHGDVLRTEAER